MTVTSVFRATCWGSTRADVVFRVPPSGADKHDCGHSESVLVPFRRNQIATG